MHEFHLLLAAITRTIGEECRSIYVKIKLRLTKKLQKGLKKDGGRENETNKFIFERVAEVE